MRRTMRSIVEVLEASFISTIKPGYKPSFWCLHYLAM